MKMKTMNILLVLLFLLPAAACANRTPAQANDPALIADWVQFLPAQGLPESLSLSAGGTVLSGESKGQWRTSQNQITIKLSGSQRVYDYTLAGYMLTLVDIDSGDAAFYINPVDFSQSGPDNLKFAGHWAAYGTNALLEFDGKGGLQELYYDSVTGKTSRQMAYTARDGILQAKDGEGTVLYNLYDIAGDTLKLADSTEYDMDNKSWYVYEKQTDRPDLQAAWKQVLFVPGGEGQTMPQVMELKDGESASVTPTGGSPSPSSWQGYGQGFILLQKSDVDLSYYSVILNGSCLFLTDASENKGWYVNDTFAAKLVPPAELEGSWQSEEPAVQLSFSAGTMTVLLEGKTTEIPVLAADGLVVAKVGEKTYYIAYEKQEDTLFMQYQGISALPQVSEPLVLERK